MLAASVFMEVHMRAWECLDFCWRITLTISIKTRLIYDKSVYEYCGKSILYSKCLQILKYRALQEYFEMIFKPNLQFYKMFGLINL